MTLFVQILPAITALIDKKLKLNGEESQNTIQMVHARRQVTVTVRELATQTSLEKLPQFSPKVANSVTTSDKATQSSLLSLHEIGTQTKKSATKKKEKKDKSRGDAKENQCQDEKGHSEDVEDPVLKLLSPV